MLRRIKIDWADLPHLQPLEIPFPVPPRSVPGPDDTGADAYLGFIEAIGLVGMGGSGFPAAEKIRACIGVHTLVINGVECEPGITIDQAVLLHHSKWVAAGADASANAVGAKHIVLAVKNNPALVKPLRLLYPAYNIVPFSDRYPAGAEKLILKKLAGRMPGPGVRPYQLGYLVQNVVSLRAIGRALIDGIPAVERPLTLAMPSAGFYKNIVAPVGMRVAELFAAFNLPFNPGTHLIAAAGLMMGHEAGTESLIEKTTTSLVVLERKPLESVERGCIRCGACNTACPLGLHPFTLTDLIKKGKTGSSAFQAQMTECFLCGACSAVCPSDIPLVQTLQEGKQCLS